MKANNQAVQTIIKTVGINGLIAIKKHLMESCDVTTCSVFYMRIKLYDNDHGARHFIFHYLDQYKDFAQYQ